MKLKYVYAVVLVGVLMVVSGCGNTATIGSDIKTLEQLKEAKATGTPLSEFDACMQEVNAIKTLETECIQSYLKENGYEDDIECILYYDNPVCTDKRYETEIDASRECDKQQSSESIDMFDCMALAGK